MKTKREVIENLYYEEIKVFGMLNMTTSKFDRIIRKSCPLFAEMVFIHPDLIIKFLGGRPNITVPEEVYIDGDVEKLVSYVKAVSRLV